MAAGLFQPINAVLRPHAPEPGTQKTLGRAAWEVLHRGMGHTTTIVAIVNIYIGMVELRKLTDDSYWYIIAYSIFLGCLVVSALGLRAYGSFAAPKTAKKMHNGDN